MNSRLASIALLVISLTILFGCAEDRATHTSTQSDTDNQTWGVLIYAAGNYEGDQLLEASLSSSRAVATVRVMETELNAPQTATQACMATPAALGEVGIYDVEFSPRIPAGLLNSELVANLGSVSTGDPQTLRMFLETSLSQMHADHYVLCLAGDGHGWQGMMGDYNNELGMPIDKLREEIASVSHLLPGGKFDILALYARNMGTIENVYELRNAADLVLTSTFNVEQPHHKIIAEWYRDLQSQPELNRDELAAYMIDAERLAQDTSEAVFFTTLWNTNSMNDVAAAFDEFSSNWLEASATQASALLTLRDELMQSELHNGVNVDIQEYAELIATTPTFQGEEFAGLLTSAQNLVNTSRSARVNYYGSEEGNGHMGLCFYFPTQTDLDSTIGDAYADLGLSQTSPVWANYVKQLPRAPQTTIRISGLGHVRTGLTVSNLVFFMDTLATGLPSPIRFLTPEWEATTTNGDSVEYAISFSLTEADSVTARFGLIMDNDLNGSFSQGDRFGFWDLPGGSNFERIVLHRGDALTGRDVFINFTRN